MNDIDRSVESFDFALRRRFQWIDIKANAIMQKSLENILKDKTEINDLPEKIKAMNEVISDDYGKQLGLSEAFHIGPAYFKGFDGNNIEDIWEKRIEPILREYTRGRDSELVKNFIKKCGEKLGIIE